MSATESSSGFKVLLGYYRKQRTLLSIDLLAIFFHAFVSISIPYVTLYIFNTTLPQGDLHGTLIAAIVLCCAVLAEGGLQWLYIQFGHWLGIRIEASMRTAFYNHIQALPFEYFDRTKTGDILSRITSDLMLVGETAHHLLEDVTEVTLVLIGAFSVMFYLNPRLATYTLIPVPFILLFASIFQKQIHRKLRSTRQHVSTISSHVENAVQGIREIKSFTRENREKQSFKILNTKFRRAFETVYTSYAPLFVGIQIMIEGYSLLYIALGAWMLSHNATTLPQIFAFYMYSRYVTMPLRRIIFGLDMYQQGLVGYHRWADFMRVPVEVDPAADVNLPTPIKGEITFTGLKFNYPKHDRVVLDIPSLTLEAGKTTAIVGPSGSGKTTLAHLIPRFYEPTEGTIALDGINTADVSKRSLRQAIGIVSQRPFLFDGTIRENLLLGNPSATDEMLMEALTQANLRDFIDTLDNPLDTPVGEHGIMLSGGQAQRIAIARIFLKAPPILILDEATSALDTFSETSVQLALNTLAQGRTTLIIAHRLTTIRNADIICYLQDGRVLEQGTHDELLAKQGEYSQLLRAAGLL